VIRRQDTYQRLEREIAGEKAAALGRAGERLEQLLAEVALIGRRIDEAAEPGARERLRAEYSAARRRALEARLALMIQREALGLRHHRVVDQQFPEPPRR
jgi:hypothetical protein